MERIEMELDRIFLEDGIEGVKNLPNESVHLIASDIPYGIGVEEWDVLHDNTNSAYMGSSPAQKKAGKVFGKRGKPLNGWSEADRQIPRQYYDWCMKWSNGWLDCLVPGGNVFIFAGRRLAHRCVSAMEDAGFVFKDMLAWDKTTAPYRAQRISLVYDRRHDIESSQKWDGWRIGNLRPLFEPILWFMKPYRIGGTIADNVLEHGVGAFNESILSKYNQTSDNIFHVKSGSGDNGLHPTQKPLDLMKLLIELTTIEGQTVLDPFAGSGTTLVAAKELGRHYIGFENDERYFSVADSRLSEIRLF
jgi:site-specific DNA-methyltransferase (adenine-specific)